MKTSNLTSWPQ